jgi:hypothetical protein
MSPADVAAKVTEFDPVRRWRLDQLRRAGYPLWDALVLSARSDVDVHRASRLLAGGCPVRTALRILI